MKKIVILGSAGSIGESALSVVATLPGRFEVVGLAVRSRGDRVLEQARQFGVTQVAVADPDAASVCSGRAPAGVRVLSGPAGLVSLARDSGADLVLCAVVGMAGLAPVLAALERGIDVALATKEVLVAAGRIVTAACARSGARLLPVDSEHSAIFQCLDGRPRESVRRLLLTASGGPFAHRPEIDLRHVTVTDALKHPRWNMGRKVSIDSATLVNKGLEIIEAHWLFGLPLERIDVVIHPESIVHSMVEFVDGNVLAQLSPTDMRYPIQYALTYPERVDGGLPPTNLPRLGALHFREPDLGRFPGLTLARTAGAAGGTMPAVLNAANEVAVQKFLDGCLNFCGIWETVEQVMTRHGVVAEPSLEAIIEADAWARREAEKIVGRLQLQAPSRP